MTINISLKAMKLLFTQFSLIKLNYHNCIFDRMGVGATKLYPSIALHLHGCDRK